jgi:hypothetical protein
VNETQTNPRSAKPLKNSNFPVERQEKPWIDGVQVWGLALISVVPNRIVAKSHELSTLIVSIPPESTGWAPKNSLKSNEVLVFEHIFVGEITNYKKDAIRGS